MKRTFPPNARLAFSALVLLLVGAPAGVSAADIRLAWDPSPSRGVVGYRIYVGTEPGVYSQTFDVGLTTWFVYQAPEMRQYYLAVAAYGAGKTVGPLSPPVSGYPRETVSFSGDPGSFYESLWREPTASGASAMRDVMPIIAPTACWTPSACFFIQTLTQRSSSITSLAATTDGRVFFIEADAQLNVLASNGVQSVLSADDPAVALTEVHLDPHFDQTGLIYVGETETGESGEREFRIARYRVAGPRAVERAVLARIPLPSSGWPRFTVAASGHIFVAVPSIPAEETPFAGAVLRFGVAEGDDGTLATTAGYATPTAMAVDAATGGPWLAGMDARNQPALSVLASDLSQSTSFPLTAPLQSLSASADADGHWLFGSSPAGGLSRARVQSDGTIGESSQMMFDNGLVQVVATTPTGVLLVAVWNQRPDGSAAYSILRLTPAF